MSKISSHSNAAMRSTRMSTESATSCANFITVLMICTYFNWLLLIECSSSSSIKIACTQNALTLGSFQKIALQLTRATFSMCDLARASGCSIMPNFDPGLLEGAIACTVQECPELGRVLPQLSSSIAFSPSRRNIAVAQSCFATLINQNLSHKVSRTHDAPC